MPVHEVIDYSDLCIRELMFFIGSLIKLNSPGKIDLVRGWSYAEDLEIIKTRNRLLPAAIRIHNNKFPLVDIGNFFSFTEPLGRVSSFGCKLNRITSGRGDFVDICYSCFCRNINISYCVQYLGTIG